MEYKDFCTFFYDICTIKQNIVKLNREQLKQFKTVFFQTDFPEWRLNLIWEFIWDDKTYDEVVYVFKEKKLM